MPEALQLAAAAVVQPRWRRKEQDDLCAYYYRNENYIGAPHQDVTKNRSLHAVPCLRLGPSFWS